MAYSDNQPLVKLGVLLPGPTYIEQGHTETWRGNVRTSDGKNNLAYIKITSDKKLVTELLCAVMAREIGLPMSRPYLVRIGAQTIPNVTREIYAFALEDVEFPMLSSRTRSDKQVGKVLLNWEALSLCTVFDSWIGNNDRLPDNLLFDGENNFSLIDHGEALDEYLSDVSVTQNKLIQLLGSKSELENFSYFKSLQEAAKKLHNVDFEKIRREIVFSNNVIRPEIIDLKIDLLQKRLNFLPNILRTQLGIKQQDFLYDSKNPSKRKYWKE